MQWVIELQLFWHTTEGAQTRWLSSLLEDGLEYCQALSVVQLVIET